MKLCKGAVLALAVSYGLIYCHTNKSKFMLEQKGDSLTLIGFRLSYLLMLKL